MAIAETKECVICGGSGIQGGPADNIACAACKGRGFLEVKPPVPFRTQPIAAEPAFVAPVAPSLLELSVRALWAAPGTKVTILPCEAVPQGELWLVDLATGKITKMVIDG